MIMVVVLGTFKKVISIPGICVKYEALPVYECVLELNIAKT